MKNFIFGFIFLAFSSSVFAEDPKYCNGQIIEDSWGKYYPNGQKMSDHWGAKYPNGTIVKDHRSIYYPNGQFTEDSWGAYYPNRQKTVDSWGVYYHNAQKVKDSWGCYYSNGQKMLPCQESVDTRLWISQNLIMKYRINTTTGKLSNVQFEEYIYNTRTLYELSLTDGVISNLEVYCDLQNSKKL